MLHLGVIGLVDQTGPSQGEEHNRYYEQTISSALTPPSFHFFVFLSPPP